MSPNPIVNMLNPLVGILNLLRGSSDPMQQLQRIAINNPKAQQALDIINQNGGNAKQAFYAEAQRKGVDPNKTIQDMLTNFGKFKTC